MTNLRTVTGSSLVRYSVGLLAIAATLLLVWPGLSSNIFALGFGGERFMPHGDCYLWVPSLVALHVSTDLLIAISYTAISMMLAYLIYRARQDMPFHWIFLAFGLFIVACGATHFMEVWTLWNATYWLSGYVKLITAAASLATAVVLPAIVPRTLVLVSDAKASEVQKRELETINQELEKQIVERKQTEHQLRQATQTLNAIFQAAPLAIYAVDSEGKVLMWNPAAERIFGWSEQEALGRLLPLVPEDRRSEFDSVRERALQGQSFADMEVQRRRNDGSVIEVSISTAPLRNGEGDIVGVLGITADITERKRVEETLRASEARLAGILNIAEDGIVSIDDRQRVILYNQGAEKIFGYSEQEVRGQSVETLIPGRFAERHNQHVLDFARSPEAARRMGERLEVYGRRKDGSEFPAEISISKLELKDETVFTAMVRDVAERKRRTEALRDSERQLAAAQQIAQLGNWESDLITRTETWSHELYRILGLLPEKVTPSWEAFLECVHPDDRVRVRGITEQALQDYQPFTYECRLLRPNGTMRILMTRGESVTDEDGKPLKLRGVGQDITERKRAEAERNAERLLVNTLFDQLPVGVLFREVSGGYSRVNQAVANMLGISEDKLIGMTPDELYRQVQAKSLDGTPLDVQDIPSIVALRTKRATAPLESHITTPHGQKRRLTIASAPLENHEGNLLGSVTVITDVTERYSLEDQLRQSQKMESIGTLAGGVAHDFNNLLTAILGHVQLAARKLAPADPLRSHLIEVEKAGNRATALTRQLLAFSRRQRLERKTIDINDTIREIMKMLRRIIGEDIDVSIQESIDAHPVFADPAQVEQVVMNLAVNARDAMPDGGQLVIDTRNVTLDEEYCREHPYAEPGKYVLMTVSDTGTGMDAETRKRIFEPFFTTKAAGKGTGLGLAMVFGIVKQHEGLIEVYSEVGHGTSFKIYLPVDEKVVKEEPQEVLEPLRGGKETILVAEDEEALRGLARTILEELGYRVLLASDGAEAIEVYQANRESVSLLVFDIVMPRMSGREAYERILEMGGDVPALFMTGYSADIVQNQFVPQNQFLERTSSALMQKPYSLETFGRKVREVLDQAKR
jgi:two-component system, cell cycle sensor histidine kinase and response regulator CckA